MTRFVSSLGRGVIAVAEGMGGAAILLGQSIASLVRPPWFLHNWFEQMLEVGNRSLPVVAVAAGFTGAVFSLQTWEAFDRFGTTSVVGLASALALTRELVPVLGALMVAGRAGSAMAAEIGTMAVTEQVDALRSMATSPVKYLVVPRLVATTLMLPVLVVIGDLLGILGSYLVAVRMFGGSESAFWDQIWQGLVMTDITGGLVKSAFFGLQIALFGCYWGFSTRGGAQGVGRATTGAVVTGSMAVLISDFFLTKLLVG